MEDEINEILAQIKCDETVVDVQWSLFQAALNSYRHDSVLRPFPAEFLAVADGNEKQFSELKSVSSEIPRLKTLLHPSTRKKLSEPAWRLLSWVVLQTPLTVTTCPISDFTRIQELTGQASYEVTPSYIFEVQNNSASNQRFEELRQSRDLIYAYHGSRLENFYSILHNGLHAHMNKNSLFGEGTYLSGDLSVCMPYSQTGKGWDCSGLGTTLSCVIVCQLIDHPDVRCQTRDQSNSVTRTHAPQSQGGEVPEKYYIVTNNEVIRVKYLLVFTSTKRAAARSTQSRSRVMMFVQKNIFFLCLIGYLLALLLIGFANSRTYQNVSRKAGQWWWW